MKKVAVIMGSDTHGTVPRPMEPRDNFNPRAE